MAEPQPPRALAWLLAIVVIAAGVGGGAYLYYREHPSPAPGPLAVGVGDNVTVNYIGIFASGPQAGRVFDTSEFSVALNNVSWPKSLQYSSRGGSQTDYSPLGVYVGSNAPSSGYSFGNHTFGSVVPGFWQGLVGAVGNQTKYVYVPPNLGYPASLLNDSCFATQPLTYSAPVVVGLSPAKFASSFPNVTAVLGAQFTDPTYGWPDVILSVNASAVVYENLPSLGMLTYPQGWAVKVTNLTTTTITLTNQLTPSQAGTLLGHTIGPDVCGLSTFIVTQVSLGNGTYLESYGSASGGNKEVYGQPLIFIVSVVNIFPAGFS